MTTTLRALTAIPCVHVGVAGFVVNNKEFSTRCPRMDCGLELLPPDGHNNQRDNVWPLLFTPGKPICCLQCALASRECLLPPVSTTTWYISCTRCNCRLRVDRDAAAGAVITAAGMEVIETQPVCTIIEAQIDKDHYLMCGQEVPDTLNRRSRRSRSRRRRLLPRRQHTSRSNLSSTTKMAMTINLWQR